MKMSLFDQEYLQTAKAIMLHGLRSHRKDGVSESLLWAFSGKNNRVARELLDELINRGFVNYQYNSDLQVRICYINFKGVWYLHALTHKTIKNEFPKDWYRYDNSI